MRSARSPCTQFWMTFISEITSISPRQEIHQNWGQQGMDLIDLRQILEGVIWDDRYGMMVLG